jgi:hypothetical protein
VHMANTCVSVAESLQLVLSGTHVTLDDRDTTTAHVRVHDLVLRKPMGDVLLCKTCDTHKSDVVESIVDVHIKVADARLDVMLQHLTWHHTPDHPWWIAMLPFLNVILLPSTEHAQPWNACVSAKDLALAYTAKDLCARAVWVMESASIDTRDAVSVHLRDASLFLLPDYDDSIDAPSSVEQLESAKYARVANVDHLDVLLCLQGGANQIRVSGGQLILATCADSWSVLLLVGAHLCATKDETAPSVTRVSNGQDAPLDVLQDVDFDAFVHPPLAPAASSLDLLESIRIGRVLEAAADRVRHQHGTSTQSGANEYTARWLSCRTHTVVEDHIPAQSRSTRDLLVLPHPTDRPPSRLLVEVQQMGLCWRMFDGHDWPNAARQTGSMLELAITGIDARIDVYKRQEASPFANRIAVACNDVTLRDFISASSFPSVVCYDLAHVNSRPLATPMLNLDVTSVYSHGVSQELRIHLVLLPLRLTLDEAAIDFLTRFFISSDYEEGTTRTSKLYIQSFSLPQPIALRIDWHSTAFDLSRWYGGEWAQLAHLVSLRDVSVQLSPVRLTGIHGLERLVKMLSEQWYADLSVRHVLAGLPLIRDATHIVDVALTPLVQRAHTLGHRSVHAFARMRSQSMNIIATTLSLQPDEAKNANIDSASSYEAGVTGTLAHIIGELAHVIDPRQAPTYK